MQWFPIKMLIAPLHLGKPFYNSRWCNRWYTQIKKHGHCGAVIKMKLKPFFLSNKSYTHYTHPTDTYPNVSMLFQWYTMCVTDAGCHREILFSWILNTAWFTSMATAYRSQWVCKQIQRNNPVSVSCCFSLEGCKIPHLTWAITTDRKGNLGPHLRTTQSNTCTHTHFTLHLPVGTPSLKTEEKQNYTTSPRFPSISPTHTQPERERESCLLHYQFSNQALPCRTAKQHTKSTRPNEWATAADHLISSDTNRIHFFFF